MGKALVEITKEISFEAAHYLHNPKWDRAKNLHIFQKCSGLRADNPKALNFPHGHSYRLRVTVKGPVNSDTGFVMDFKILKELLKNEIFDRFDHRFINLEVEPFMNKPLFQTTVENVSQVMWDRLSPVIRKHKVVLHELTLWETPTSFATYRGGK
ncbi:MAG TPA: 6-carboxytetrahydropterin synthase [bacterium]